MAGGGCTLPCGKVLMPGQGYEGVEFVMDVITERGVNACPPLLVLAYQLRLKAAARLSKLAIMRPVDSTSENPRCLNGTTVRTRS